MILVVLGTHELPFTRLLEEIDHLKNEGYIQDEVIVQCGHTDYQSNQMTLKGFLSYEEMEELYDRSTLIITHAGTGSVITGLRKNKKVIAAARLKKFGEHNDDHQLQLLNLFTMKGHILAWHDGEPLMDVIKQAETFVPIPFESDRQRMLKIIENFIEGA